MTVQRVLLTSMLHDRAMGVRPARSDWSHLLAEPLRGRDGVR